MKFIANVLIVVLLASGCATAQGPRPAPLTSEPAQLAISEEDRKACEEFAQAEAAAFKGRSLGAAFGDGVEVGAATLLGIAGYGAGFVVLGTIGVAVQARENAKMRQAAHDQTLETCLKELSSTDSLELPPADLAKGFQRLADHYSSEGSYAAAELAYKRVLAIQEETLGSDHLEVADTLEQIARVSSEQRKYADAEPLYRQALAIRERAWGADDPQMVQSLQAFADWYVDQERHAEAGPLYERALRIQEQALGPEHADLTKSLHKLADTHVAQGNYAEAVPLYRRAIAIHEQELGGFGNPELATILDAYAILLEKMDRLAEAEEVASRAHEIWGKPHSSDVAPEPLAEPEPWAGGAGP